ncbi:chorismate-binding protein [Lentiprolixibacter aurantiacus]|uniref:Chorismate-binding protein n=1 Tax=Lentiprolixibacter aurantiacus TaxID=2993939 RepID=A0AAE3MLC6_9FLAO|nr:chorismate-binding protein [Lentiprolixibacter aurantiacus]MCX2719436.1 chorismate-binding protein [Lentiprolixibacter aurantiacus]
MELFNRLKKHYREGLPFVLYRKPGSSVCTALMQNSDSLDTTVDFSETGFVMAPFSEGLPVIRVRPDEVLTEKIRTAGDRMPFSRFMEHSGQSGKAEYIDRVRKALEVIKAKELQKIVLSRKISINLKPDPFYTFQVLLRQFPEAFCYFLYHQKTGIWMGASPETLLRYGKDEISTVSLAGTQKAVKGMDPVWSTKEKKEQAYVTRFIEQALDGLAGSLDISGTETAKAGNLLHLKTVIRAGDLKAGLRQFIHALHPTPAVCGIPADKARAYLLANEGYPRAYYTGYLGELNWNEDRNSHLFVNLRCMNLLDDQVHVYVGGGLVEGSDPEQEWQETVNKSESMLHLFRNSAEGLG